MVQEVFYLVLLSPKIICFSFLKWLCFGKISFCLDGESILNKCCSLMFQDLKVQGLLNQINYLSFKFNWNFLLHKLVQTWENLKQFIQFKSLQPKYWMFNQSIWCQRPWIHDLLYNIHQVGLFFYNFYYQARTHQDILRRFGFREFFHTFFAHLI